MFRVTYIFMIFFYFLKFFLYTSMEIFIISLFLSHMFEIYIGSYNCPNLCNGIQIFNYRLHLGLHIHSKFNRNYSCATWLNPNASLCLITFSARTKKMRNTWSSPLRRLIISWIHLKKDKRLEKNGAHTIL